MNPVFEMFNDIANNMRLVEDGEEYISNTIKLVGASGKPHELSINQAQLFLGVLDGNHPFLTEYNPLEFLIFSYQIQEKFKTKYLATYYEIIYDHEEDAIIIEAICKHPMTVEGHPEYVLGANIPAQHIRTEILDVGLYGALALVNCIAAQDESFKPIHGSFGGSFVFTFEKGQQSIRKYIPQEDALPETSEVDEAIQKAIQKVANDTPVEHVPTPNELWRPAGVQYLGDLELPPQ